MKKIASLVAASLLCLSALSSAGVSVNSAGTSLYVFADIDEETYSNFHFQVRPRYVRVFANDENDNFFHCHAFSDSNKYDELKEFIYSIKNDSTVYMRKDSNDQCIIGSYRYQS